MILAIDTSTTACTAALFEGDNCVARADELIGRGHAERLAPMLDELLDGRRADAIIVGVGPGSFTGIRVGIAAAHGLAIGWDVPLHGMSSLALLAASAEVSGAVAAAVKGGHGELFVQQFDEALNEAGPLMNLPPNEAAFAIDSSIVAGSGADALVNERGSGQALDVWPSAANTLRLPQPLRSLSPTPLYARAPDAKARNAA